MSSFGCNILAAFPVLLLYCSPQLEDYIIRLSQESIDIAVYCRFRGSISDSLIVFLLFICWSLLFIVGLGVAHRSLPCRVRVELHSLWPVRKDFVGFIFLASFLILQEGLPLLFSFYRSLIFWNYWRYTLFTFRCPSTFSFTSVLDQREMRFI